MATGIRTYGRLDMVNEATGEVDSPGIRLMSPNASLNLVNRGRILFNEVPIIDGSQAKGAMRIENSGTIDGDIAFGFGDDTLVLLPGGTIEGMVTDEGGTDTLILGGAGAGDFDLREIGDHYDGFETFRKEGDSTWTVTGSGSQSWTVAGGILRLNGTTTGSVTVLPGATLRGTGSAGAATIQGTLAPGASPGTLTFAGSVVMDPASTLAIEIDGLGTGNGAGNYSRVLVTGAGNTFTADGTLQPILRGISAPATNSFTPAVGDTFTIVQADGGVVGTFDTLVQPTTGLAPGTAFAVSYTANAIVLSVMQLSFATVCSQGANQQAVAAALDAVQRGAPTPEQAALIAALWALPQGQLAAACTGLGGQVHADTIMTVLSSQRLLERDIEYAVAGRLGADASAAGDGEVRFWGGPTGRWGEFEGDGTAVPFDTGVTGGTIAADTTTEDGLVVGGAFSYAASSAD